MVSQTLVIIIIIKVKLSLCLIKHRAMKTHGGGENSSTHS